MYPTYLDLKKVFSTILLLFVTTIIVAQTTQTNLYTANKKNDSSSLWGIKFSGFVRNNVFFDSRQVVSARPAAQGDLLLFPAPVSNDINGKDINATPSLSMLSIDSRLSGAITGPDAFGAKTSGVLEAEFFGNANGNENIFRLRHAFVKLDWAKTQLIIGQFWHPLYVPDCAPGVISINAGMPFQPFSRNPQIRVTQKLSSSFNLILAATSQIESFVSPGSSTGVALGSSVGGPNFIEDAVIPNLHAQLQYKSTHILAGAALDYKEVRPALSEPSAFGATTTFVATTENVSGLSYEVYAKLNTKPLIVKAAYTSGQNLYDQLMIGGYLAYASSGANYHITYKPINVAAMWMDIMGTGKIIVPGIFIGYTQNNGSDAGAVASYARGITLGKASLDNIWRVTPRVEIYSGKFKIGTEVEVTDATYGISSTDGKVTGTTQNVTNVRVLFTTAYYF